MPSSFVAKENQILGVASAEAILERTGIRLHSVFQSVLSVSHARVVGHEALLRGVDRDGTALTPSQIFPRLVSKFCANSVNEFCARLHLGTFQAHDREGWLFLNVNPDAVPSRRDVYERFGSWLRDADIPAHRIVVEVVETRSIDEKGLAEAVEGFRDLGCLVAIDDFGAGESNFERVWRLRPDVVKLDRAMLEEATQNPLVRRILPGIVSLVHEAGCLVVLEGIETEEQALLAMECDVDFVQGYHFSRPTLDPPPREEAKSLFLELEGQLRQHLDDRNEQDRGFFESYMGGFEACAHALEEGDSLRDACATFLALAGVQRVYLLDQDGQQMAGNVEARDTGLASDPRFDPCADAEGASWFRRPYFQRAIQRPRATQVSRPYLSIRDAKTCVTLSIAYDSPDGLCVLCADLSYALPEPAGPWSVRESGVHSSR